MLTLCRRFAGVLALLALALPGRAAEVDRYVPADSEQVIVINVQQILESGIVKKHFLPEVEKQLKANKDLQQLQQLTGLDPLKDIKSLVIANSGTTGEKATLIVRGKFDTEKIHTVAEAIAKDKKDKVKISKLGDRHLYEGELNGRAIFFTFIDGTTAIGSLSKENVVAATEGKSGKVNKDLAAAFAALDAKQSIVVAGLVPEEARKKLGEVEQAQSLKTLKAVSGSLNITSSLAASGRLSMTDQKAAQKLAKDADAAKALLAFVAQSNEELAPFVNELLSTLKIQPNKGDVTISFKFSEEIVDKAIKLIPKN